jgi:hypothetical protein
MKRGLLLGFGLPLLLFSPLWLTLAEPRNYLNFGICFVLGILLILGLLPGNPRPPPAADCRRVSESFGKTLGEGRVWQEHHTLHGRMLIFSTIRACAACKSAYD